MKVLFIHTKNEKNKITIYFSAYNNKQTAYQIGATYKRLGYEVYYSN